MIGRFLRSALIALVGLVLATPAAAAEQQGRRWAVLVGVDDYANLTKLKYCQRDAEALRERLLEAGFAKENVFLLTSDASNAQDLPLKANIERQLKAVLGLAEKGDMVLVSFSGHGVHLGETSYLCPADADPERPAATMLAVADLYRILGNCPARQKIVLIDACRTVAKEGRAIALEAMHQSFARSVAAVPEGLRVLSSCREGQASHEDEQLKHGIFMYYLLEGLSGAADGRIAGASGNGNGRVEDAELFAYASSKTRDFVRKHLDADQEPEYHSRLSHFIELVELTPPPPRLVNSVGMEFVLVPRGDFLMGSPDDAGHANERPRHRVHITQHFYFGKTEVTQAQYQKVMGENPSWFSASAGGSTRVAGRDTQAYPVESVSYAEALDFCKRLCQLESVPQGTYRLPTEAEWEYAARAGSHEEYGPAGNGIMLEAAAWFSENADGRTHEVGSLRPNGFGLYDVLGNVAEWCSDWYSPDGYGAGPAEDPAGPVEPGPKAWKTLRGGSWLYGRAFCRVADRYAIAPERHANCGGFRIVRNPQVSPPAK